MLIKYTVCSLRKRKHFSVSIFVEMYVKNYFWKLDKMNPVSKLIP